MMSSKDGVGQIIKTLVTVVTFIVLTSWFRVIKATLNNLFRLTRGTHNAVGPAQLTNRLITLHLVDEILDVDLHGRTPVRDRGMGCRQYTSSSHATTLESNKSACESEAKRCWERSLSYSSQKTLESNKSVRQIVRQPLSPRRDLPLFQVGYKT